MSQPAKQPSDQPRADRPDPSTTPQTTPQTTPPSEHRAEHGDTDEGKANPTFPEARLTVTALVDPVLDSLGHDPRSAYVEQYWLSILGPSALLLLRRLANRLEAQPDGFELDPLEWALELGLGARGGRHSPMWRSVERICRFGAGRRNGELLAVRRHLPPLTQRQIDRLPDHLRRAHERWSAQRLQEPRRTTISQWSARHEPEGPAGDRRVIDSRYPEAG